MLSGVHKNKTRKKIQPRTNFDEVPPAQKQMRALTVLKMLCEKPMGLEDIADTLNVTKRTVYRYCALIVELGCALEPDEDGKYHIDQCPFCKKELA